MSLDYTSLIERIIPNLLFEDPVCLRAMRAGLPGIQPGSRSNEIMLFVDPRTVSALLQADPKIRQAFLNSGYGLKPWEDTSIESPRIAFLRSEFHKLVARAEAEGWDDDALGRGAVDLIRYMDEALQGVHLKPGEIPMVWDKRTAKALRMRVREPFDLAEAMASAKAQLEQPPAPPVQTPRRGLLSRLRG